MGCLSVENFHAKKEKAVLELVKGKEIAIQLQTLLHKPVEDHGPVSAEELALKIFRSFSDTLSEFTSSTYSAQIAAVDCGGSASSRREQQEARSQRSEGLLQEETSDSLVTVSPTTEDGCAWRKYGQKNILNSEYPRCYFRCTHKHDGCKAIKQVQRLKGDPILYQTTYFNQHTCKGTLLTTTPQLILESDPVEHNLISFQTNIPSKQDQNSSNPIIISSVKQEDTQSEDLSHEAKSTLEDPWQDIVGLEPLGYKPEWAPYQEEVASRFHSCDSTSLHGLDQLSDIDSLNYFDEI